ncbi:MAG TPA: hypothetical protein VLU96_02210 [Gaiellaceae bacterium]|nr:hypothetical protein [Gaiellaceae bacterium]
MAVQVLLTAKQRDNRLRKLDGEITAATAELRDARKQAALDEIEREFAGVSGEAA